MTATVHHGDARDLIDKYGPTVNCIVTDPPYGANFVSRRAQTPEGKRFVRAVENDADLAGAMELFSDVFTALARRTPEEADAYVFTRWDIVGEWIELIRSLEPETGFRYKMLLVWDKGVPGMGDIDSNWGCGHELILYCKKGHRPVPYRRSAIIAVDKVPNTQHVHPTEKPVPLLERLIEMSTDPGDLVVDPFAGSGSTLVAARNLNRDAIGFEIDEHYIEVIRRRLEQPTFDF